MDTIVAWAEELQSIAQAGLYYGKDVFDRERYQRIRDIATEMMAVKSGLTLEEVTKLFCSDCGYQTPKVDTRAAVFREGKILLVQEVNGAWALPGGWCEFDISPAENAVKECKEEAGLDVIVKFLIAVQDRDKHHPQPYPFHVVKHFFLCEAMGGAFVPNSETVASDWFALDALPKLAENKCTYEQIAMCFAASQAEHWIVPFD